MANTIYQWRKSALETARQLQGMNESLQKMEETKKRIKLLGYGIKVEQNYDDRWCVYLGKRLVSGGNVDDVYKTGYYLDLQNALDQALKYAEINDL
jgi:hypothetical protein